MDQTPLFDQDGDDDYDNTTKYPVVAGKYIKAEEWVAAIREVRIEKANLTLFP